jgi:hypothetical protein
MRLLYESIRDTDGGSSRSDTKVLPVVGTLQELTSTLFRAAVGDNIRSKSDLRDWSFSNSSPPRPCSLNGDYTNTIANDNLGMPTAELKGVTSTDSMNLLMGNSLPVPDNLKLGSSLLYRTDVTLLRTVTR